MIGTPVSPDANPPFRDRLAGQGGTTPVPNALFDVVLPTLSDTQLRVLLVVARSTLGWRAGDGRKESDWLSHRQLQSRTGRAGAAVSGAIDALVRRGLLEVRDSAGERRSTTSARRAARGPLFYRLGRALASQKMLTSEASASQSEVIAPTDSRMSDLSKPIFERSIPKVSSLESGSTSERGLHKAKTTKETQTKEKETKERKCSTEISLDLSSLGSEVLSIGERQIAQLQGFPAKTPIEGGTEIPAAIGPSGDEALKADDIPANEVEAFVRRFQSAYAQAKPGQTCPPIEAQDLSLLGRYLETHGAPLLERWLPAFFASDFGYVRRRSWSLGSYLNSIFVLQAKKGQKAI